MKQAETAAERDVQMLQMLEPEEMVSNWPQVQQAFQTEMQASTQRIRKEIMEEQAQSNEELRQRESQRNLISQQLMGEIRRAREDAQEKELKQEKMMQMMLQAQEEMKQSQAAPRVAPMAVVAGAPASTWRKCHCGAAPEKFQVKKDGPRHKRWSGPAHRCHHSGGERDGTASAEAEEAWTHCESAGAKGWVLEHKAKRAGTVVQNRKRL